MFERVIVCGPLKSRLVVRAERSLWRRGGTRRVLAARRIRLWVAVRALRSERTRVNVVTRSTGHLSCLSRPSVRGEESAGVVYVVSPFSGRVGS